MNGSARRNDSTRELEVVVLRDTAALERMGATAVTALLNALGRLEQGAPVPVVHEVLSPDLVVRDSSSSAPSVAAG